MEQLRRRDGERGQPCGMRPRIHNNFDCINCAPGVNNYNYSNLSLHARSESVLALKYFTINT